MLCTSYWGSLFLLITTTMPYQLLSGPLATQFSHELGVKWCERCVRRRRCSQGSITCLDRDRTHGTAFADFVPFHFMTVV